MNSQTQTAIVEEIQSTAMSRRFRIATLTRRVNTLPIELSLAGHIVVVLGDRFQKLYALGTRASTTSVHNLFILECALDKLPLGVHGLDALVLCDEFPDLDYLTALKQFQKFLKPGGMMVWPHRTAVGRFSKSKSRHKSVGFYNSTAILMEAGYCSISQIPIKKRTSNWTITTGIAGRGIIDISNRSRKRK